MKLEIQHEEKYSGRMNGNYIQRVLNCAANTPIMNDDTLDFYTTNPVSRVDITRDCYDEDTKPLMLLNLDNQNKRKASSFDSNYDDEPPYKKSLFINDYEDDKLDLHGWRNKPVEEWDQRDTTSWLIHSGGKLGQPYKQTSPYLSLPGKRLLLLSREDFMNRDRLFGERLYDLLHEEDNSKSYLPPFDTLNHGKRFSDDETSVGSGNNFSDGEPFNAPDTMKKRRPGRPPLLDPKRKVAKEKLWEFIRNLLLNPKYCPQWICWDNYEKKRFRFVHSDRVAKLWGARKNNKNMTYEKFSRAMRYYYPKKIFVAVPGRRLVYEFGHKATGLETSNPNFSSNIYGDAARSRDFN